MAPGGGLRWAALLVALPGCGVYAQGSAGYTTTPRGDRSLRGVAVNADAGANIDEIPLSKAKDPIYLAPAAGLHVRGRATRDNQQGGLGPELALRLILNSKRSTTRLANDVITPMEIFVRGGVPLVQLGADQGRFAGGVFSPFAELGTAWMLGHEDVPFFTLGGSIERDVRFTSQPGRTFVTALLGVGLFTSKPSGSGGGAFFGH